MTLPSRARVLVAMAFLAFVSLGLPDAVLGVAWPFVRGSFGLPIDRLGLLLASGTAGYLASSFLAGQAVRAVGVGQLLLASTLLVVAALAGYATTPRWEALLPLALCVGLGSGAIDAAINAFAASAFSTRTVTWLHACYGIGATAGPLLMTAAVTSGPGWRWGYGWIALAMAGMAVGFAATLRLWGSAAGGGGGPASAGGAGLRETLRRPVVLLHVLFFFLYTGTEVTAGQWLFSVLREGRSFSDGQAGVAVGGFWAALTAGRVVLGQLAARVDGTTILRGGLALAPAGAGLLCWRSSPLAAVGGACLLGFALAPVFPMLIAATPARVGRRFAAQAIGFQVSAATVGVAALPSLAGLMAKPLGTEAVPPFLVVATLALVVVHEAALAASGRGADGPVAGGPVAGGPAVRRLSSEGHAG